MHILVVSQFFYPESFRYNDIAVEFAKRGYKVTVLTGIPNYPMGKFFPGYSWTKKRREKWNGIDIIRIPIIPRGKNYFGMILNLYSFVVSGWLWNQANDIHADIVFSFESSPFHQLKVGCWYAKKHKVPHYAYVQDLWPENFETVTGIHNRLIVGPIDTMVDKIYSQLDKIFVTSPAFVEAVVNRKKTVDRNKVIYWPQYAEEFYRPIPKQNIESIPDDNCFKIAFTGNIGYAQGLDILPRTAMLLKGEDIRFIIVGDGRYLTEFIKLINNYNVNDMFILIPRVESKRIPEILSVCDAGFVSFSNNALWEKTIPAKMQSYMACGKAIVASAAGETKRIIEESGCGICCELGSAESLAQGIRELSKDDIIIRGAKARAYFEKHFQKTMLIDKMVEYLSEVNI